MTDRRKALYEAFRHKGIEPDTSFLVLNAQDALELLTKGTSEGLILAGVEGFLITDQGAYESREDFSNDFADWGGTYPQFVKETIDLIERGGNLGIRFEVMFEAEE